MHILGYGLESLPTLSDACTIVGIWWIGWLLINNIRAQFTFVLVRVADPRWFAVSDVPAYSLLCILLAFDPIQPLPVLAFRILVAVSLGLLWWRARTAVLRESELFVRGSHVCWNTIREVSVSRVGKRHRIELLRQWHRPVHIHVDSEESRRVVTVIQGASRYEPTPFLFHLRRVLSQSLLAILLLFLAATLTLAIV